MQSVIKIVEVNTGEVLQELPMEELEKAYEVAHQYENMGLEIKLDAPNIHETLGSALGYESEQMEGYNESIAHEIGEHLPSDDSCCTKTYH